MPIFVKCDKCQASFKARDQDTGKRGKCPKCGHQITVPAQPVESPIATEELRPASEPQKAYATSLGITFPADIDVKSMSRLISQKVMPEKLAQAERERQAHEEAERKAKEENLLIQQKVRNSKLRKPTKAHKAFSEKHGVALSGDTSMNEILLLIDNVIKARKREKEQQLDSAELFERIDKLRSRRGQLPIENEYTAAQLTEVMNEMLRFDGPPLEMCDEQELVDYVDSMGNHVVLIVAERSDPKFPSVYLSKKSTGKQIRNVVNSAMTECTRFAIVMRGGEPDSE